MPVRSAAVRVPQIHHLPGSWQSSILSVWFWVAVAATLYFFRAPDAWLNPQLWAEDGPVFLQQSLLFGWDSLFVPYAGYHLAIPRLTALAALPLPLEAVPAFYTYVSGAFVTLTLSLVLSPRLPFSYKPLLALAVVLVPHSGEVFATLTNIQWFLPLGLLVMAFMQPPASRAGQWLEAGYIGLAGLTGPFSLFLAPIFVVQTWLKRHDGAAFRRLVLLSAILAATAALQAATILDHHQFATGDASPPLLWWIAIAVKRAFGMMIPYAGGLYSDPATAWIAFSLTIAFLSGIAACVWVNRRSFAIWSMIFFGLCVLAASLWKSRFVFHQLIVFGPGDRYFFIVGIMILWCIIGALGDRHMRFPAVVLLASALIASGMDFVRPPRPDLGWAEHIERASMTPDSPATIPINPPRWQVTIPAGYFARN